MAEAISMNIGGNDYNIKDSVARAQLDLVNNQITSGVISDVQMVDFSKITNNKTINSSGALIDSGTSFVTDYIPVSQGQKIAIKIPRAIAGYNSSKTFVSGSYVDVMSPYAFTYYTVPSGVYYVRIAGYNAYMPAFTANLGEEVRHKEPYYKADDIKMFNVGKNTTLYSENYLGSLSTGDSITFPKNNVVKNVKYSFSAKVISLSELKIGHGNAGNNQPYLHITSTNADIVTSSGTDAHVHGLTLSEYINITINAKNTTADIMIGSGGQVFTLNDVSWYTGGNASDHVDCVNGALSNCIFTVSYPDMAKGLWICGDSYITINDSTRWAYYLGEFGQLDNVMLHGYPGQGSITAIPSLEKELLLSVPKALVYCYGMNDGSDSDSVAANNWQYGFENIKALSNKYGFELILATIPTVPSINNEVKNSTIRNSKYRFIDFAKAVGASSSGVWYTGMLATDNVHPRIPGGFALYNAAIQAVPEIASDK